MATLLDRLNIVHHSAAVARFWLDVTSWTEGQIRQRLDAIAPVRSQRSPDEGAAPAGALPERSLSAKMQALLQRALDHSTQSSQVELFHHVLDQLVADEARIISALSDGSAAPLINVYSRTGSLGPGRAMIENASLVGRNANVALPDMVPTYVGHLLSLGIVVTGPEDSELDKDYEILLAESDVLAAVQEASLGPLTAKVDKLTLRLSGLGQALWAAAMERDER